MRLIDADAFDKVLEDAEIEATRNRKYVFRSALNIIRGNLRNAPTIEERKKGKWIRETKHYKDDEQEYYYYEEHCSCCGVKRRIGWGYASFCPNCGAELI